MSTKHEQSMAQTMEEEDDAAVRRLLNRAVEAFKPELRNPGSMMACIYVCSGALKSLTPLLNPFQFTKLTDLTTYHSEHACSFL